MIFGEVYRNNGEWKVPRRRSGLRRRSRGHRARLRRQRRLSSSCDV
ncbi:hypothetical protein HMPREF0321_0216 [Dermacoccus sp. Ellin185]|nr:hypothetical protein HMPREF0321_0216 [Dermacoccus sp. Ellin185]